MVTAPGRNPIGAPPGSRRRGSVPDVSNVRSVSPGQVRDPGVRATAADFGAAEAEALEDVGRSTMQAAAQFERKAQRAQLAEDRAFDADVATSVALRSQEALLELQAEVDRASPEYETKARETLDQVRAAAIAQARRRFRPSAEALELTESTALRRQVPFLSRVGVDAHNARVERALANAEGRFAELEVKVQRDPSFAPHARAAADDIFESLKAVLPAGKEIEVRRDYDRRLSFREVTGLIEKRPGVALDLLEAGEFDDSGLEADDLLKLQRAAEAELERRQKANADAAERLAETELARIRLGADRDPLADPEAAKAERRIMALNPEVAEEFRIERDRLLTVGRAAAELAVLPPAEIGQRLEALRPDPESRGFTPEAAETWEETVKAVARERKRLEQDPVSYFAPHVEREIQGLRNDADFEEADEAEARIAISLRMQREAGIVRPRALSEQAAKDTVAALQQTPADQRVERIAGLEQEAGRFWPVVFADLVDAGLDPLNKALVRVSDDPVTSQHLAEVIQTGPSELAKGIDKVDRDTARDTIRDELDEYLTAVRLGDPTGGREAALNQEIETAESLALLYMRQGATPDDAGRRAAEQLVGNRVEIVDTFYVPRHIGTVPTDPGKVEAFARDMQTPERIEAFGPQALGSLADLPVEIRRRGLIATAVNSGFWVTNADGTGAFLMVPVGGTALPLVNDLGQRYEFGFIEASESDARPFRVPEGGAFEMGAP